MSALGFKVKESWEEEQQKRSTARRHQPPPPAADGAGVREYLHGRHQTQNKEPAETETAASLLVPLFVGSSAAGQGFQRGVRASSRLQAPITFVDQRFSQAPGPRDGLPRRMPSMLPSDVTG